MNPLPLFPLSAVLLPYGRMPLQIFERRYVDLVKESMRSGEGFGIVRIERGREVAEDDLPALAPVGTVARIVDFDQLDNGLLGITVAGERRFRLQHHWREPSDLVHGEVTLLPTPEPVPLREEWVALADLLRGLEAHPHVQRIGLDIDFDDGWQVAYTLLQLLPLEESIKSAMLAADDIDVVFGQLNMLLGEISGEA
jgi:Lon protease-like protein